MLRTQKAHDEGWLPGSSRDAALRRSPAVHSGTMTTHEDPARGMYQALRGTSEGMPAHLVRRLTALLGDQEILYVQQSWPASHSRAIPITGTLVIFTARFVVRCELTNSALTPNGEERSVGLEVWPRTSLEALSQPTTESMLADWLWDATRNEAWPRGGRVVLRYPHGELTLPLPGIDPDRHTDREFVALLPTLFDDLAA